MSEYLGVRVFTFCLSKGHGIRFSLHCDRYLLLLSGSGLKGERRLLPNRIGHWVLHPMMMIKEGGADLLPSSDPKAPSSAADAGVFGKGRYRFWALAAILLLAFWSMLTGTVTLRWSAGDFNRLAHDFDVPVAVNPDLDVLEMEEREKAVRHMWDVYAHAQTRRIRLPRFWQEAFEAAYQDLSGDDPDARDAAVAEIARMSVRMLDPEAPPRTPKAAEIKRNQRLRDGISSLESGSSSSDAR